MLPRVSVRLRGARGTRRSGGDVTSSLVPLALAASGAEIARAGASCDIQCGYIAEVAEALCVIEAVADREAIADMKAHITEIELDPKATGLGQQGASLQRTRATRSEVAHEVLKRQAGLDNVLDNQDVPALDRSLQVLENAHHARGISPRAIT